MKYTPVFVLVVAFALILGTTGRAAEPKVWIPGWKDTAGMTTARAGSAVVTANGYLYAIGGVDGRRFLDSTEYSAINDDGTLSPWRTTAALTEPRGFLDAVVINGFIYAAGGGNGPAGHNLLNSIERARILPDGSLGPWRKESSTLNLPRRCIKLVNIGDTIYAFGGFAGTLLDSVERAVVRPDGTVGKWQLMEDTLRAPRYVHAAKKTRRSIIILGGHQASQGTGLASVEWAALSPSRTLSGWREATTMNTGRYGLSAAVHGDAMYALGGLDGAEFLRVVERTIINPANGEPGPWKTTNPLSSPRANFGVAVANDHIYVVGGTNASGYYDSVEYSTFNERGDIGFWGTAAEGHAYEQSETQTRTAVALPLPHRGAVMETIDAGQYTYIHVKQTNHQDEWVATSRGLFSPGQVINYSDGVMMENFYSKSLERTFPSIRFVSRVEKAE
jgi:hypothetical protein